jgi:hypothetical protein
MEGEEDPLARLRILVGPNPPAIFAAPRPPRVSVNAPSNQPPQIPNCRFNKHPNVAPGEIPYRPRPDTASHVQDLAEQSHVLSLVKAEQSIVADMQAKMDAYAQCAAVKRAIQHQDYEDHFDLPLHARIREQLDPRSHKAFLKRRKEAIEAMDQKPIPVRSHRRPPKIPSLSVSRKGLQDPTYKYIRHREAERQIVDVLARAQGEDVRRTPKKKEPRLDYQQIDIEHHTRFYFGTSEDANQVGKKVFACHNRSEVARAVDMYGGPMPYAE